MLHAYAEKFMEKININSLGVVPLKTGSEKSKQLPRESKTQPLQSSILDWAAMNLKKELIIIIIIILAFLLTEAKSRSIKTQERGYPAISLSISKD